MNMRAFLLVLLPMGLTLPGIASAEWTGNFNAFLGGKALNEDDFRADEHREIGTRLDFKRDWWPVSIAADMNFSRGDDKGNVTGVGYVDEQIDTFEFNLGVRKYWEAMNIRPFLGGGVAYTQLNLDRTIDSVTDVSERGDGFGFWVNGGVAWTFNAFNIGFDLGYTQSEVDLSAGDFDSGGGHAGILLGYHW